MPTASHERSPHFQKPLWTENFELQDLKLAVATFKKLKEKYGPMNPTKPYSPINVFGDFQRFATRGYLESVIDADELGAFLGLAADIQMILFRV